MQEFKFSRVREGVSEQLEFFDAIRQETSIFQHERINFYPTSAIVDGGPITFRIDGSSFIGYLDPTKTNLCVQVKIIRPDGLVLTSNPRAHRTSRLKRRSVGSTPGALSRGKRSNPGENLDTTSGGKDATLPVEQEKEDASVQQQASRDDDDDSGSEVASNSATTSSTNTEIDNSQLPPASFVVLTNNVMGSLFSEVSLNLNGISPNPTVSTLYSYKRYIELLLNKDKDWVSSEGQNQGYTADSIGENRMRSTDVSSFTNLGLEERIRWTDDDRTATFMGPLGLDEIGKTGKCLTNGVDIQITLFQHRDSFRLLAPDNNTRYRVRIVKAWINACVVRARPEVLVKQDEMLTSGKLAYYYYPKTSLRYSIIPQGVSRHEVNSILDNRVPSQVVVVFVRQDAFNGVYNKNPFYFEHLNVSEIGVYLGATPLMGRPLTADFEDNEYTEVYNSFLEFFHARNCSISKTEFAAGNTMYAFDVQHQTNLDDGVFPIMRRGACRMEVTFRKPLDETYVAILYMRSAGCYNINSARTVTVEY